MSHLSMHLAWKTWLQRRARMLCFGSKSYMQTTHTVCSPSSADEPPQPPLNRYVGSSSNSERNNDRDVTVIDIY